MTLGIPRHLETTAVMGAVAIGVAAYQGVPSPAGSEPSLGAAAQLVIAVALLIGAVGYLILKWAERKDSSGGNGGPVNDRQEGRDFGTLLERSDRQLEAFERVAEAMNTVIEQFQTSNRELTAHRLELANTMSQVAANLKKQNDTNDLHSGLLDTLLQRPPMGVKLAVAVEQVDELHRRIMSRAPRTPRTRKTR